MSAMPAEATKVNQGAVLAPASVRIPASRSQLRAARQAQLKEARRDRRRWSIISCAILGATFGLTVGILDVLH
jgi:hypothetical protein